MIEIQGISKQYESIRAVDSLSIDVKPGKICGFLGPNGAGKTTAIRMLMNIIMPDSGSIQFNGSTIRPESSRIGYLPEERGLYQKISVNETLQYFAHLRNVNDANQKIKTNLDRFDLGARLNTKVNELSKGNQQKLQFINTILHDPEYVVLDEPFSGLDPVNQLILKEILEEMRTQGKTIIFSSHQMDQVEKICDDVALINQGKLVTSGSLQDVLSAHDSKILEVTPAQAADLDHAYFSEFESELRNGSIFLKLHKKSKKEVIHELNELIDLKSIRVAKPGLEAIFIKLVQGTSK